MAKTKAKSRSANTKNIRSYKKKKQPLLRNHKGFIPLRNKSNKIQKIKLGSGMSKKTKILGLVGILAFGGLGSYMQFFSSAAVPNLNGFIISGSDVYSRQGKLIRTDAGLPGNGADRTVNAAGTIMASFLNSKNGSPVAELTIGGVKGTGLQAIDLRPLTGSATYQTPAYAAWSPDSRNVALQLYTATGSGVIITDVNTRSSKILESSRDEFAPHGAIGWKDDGTIIYLKGGEICQTSVSTDTTNCVEVNNEGNNRPGTGVLYISGDSRSVVGVGSQGKAIYEIQLDGSAERTVVSTESGTHETIKSMALSPDKSQIAFAGGTKGRELFTINTNGSAQQKIVPYTTSGSSITSGVFGYLSWVERMVTNSAHVDFNGDGFSDIYFYAPGSGADYIWYGTATVGKFDSQRKDVSGTYKPITGDFNADGYSDIIWYAPGSGADSVWYGTATKSQFTSKSTTINGTYVPIPSTGN